MLVRRILNMVVGMHLENKTYLKQSLWASTFIQDENSKMKYWEHEVDKDTDPGNISKEIASPYESTYATSYSKYAESMGYNSNDEIQKDKESFDTTHTDRNQSRLIMDNLSDTNQPEESLSHLDGDGRANMVDVGSKDTTKRMARAIGIVDVGETAYNLIANNQISKGNVMTVAQVAGILAAKRTSDLIPLCHPIQLNKVDVKCHLMASGSRKVQIESIAHCEGKTGVEMEALTGVSIAALTIYDMCKAVNKSIVIESIRLEEKRGGKSDYLHTQTS